MNTPKQVLLCAYACEPDKGSEPGVGWDTSINLAKQDSESDYFIITRRNNKESIENKRYPKNIKFIYYELPRLFLFIKRKGNFIRTYYYFWMFGAVIKLWNKRNDFNIIHHITFVNDWLPSIFILLKTKSNYFIWGSIGSNNTMPLKFTYNSREKLINWLTYLLQFFFRTFDMFFWRCKYKSDIIIGINENVKNKLKLSRNQIKKFRVIPAIAIDDIEIEQVKGTIINKNKGFNIISVGKLIQIKNFRLVIMSFANFLNRLPSIEKSDIKLTIIGEGRLKNELLFFAKKLKINDNINFIGHITQNQVMEQFQKSDVFLFPTMESAGFVVLEAMSNSLPVVALNYGGPKQFVIDNQNKQLVSIEEPIEDVTSKISEKLWDFYNNPKLAKEVGISNKNIVIRNFTWKHKIDCILKIYNQLLSMQ